MHSVGTVGLWGVFFVFVIIVFSIDMLLLGGRKAQKVSVRKALLWTIIWMFCALIFNVVLWWFLSHTQGASIANQKSLEFFTGYIIEESLSVDNMFVILMIFTYFSVSSEYQRRVLQYGVLGAIVLRLFMITLGSLIIARFHWVLYIFGFFLAITGINMFFTHEKKELSNTFLVQWLTKHLRLTKGFHQEKFFVRQDILWYATPLFLVLVLVEFSDVIFALDSIPAIFAITTDPFIVFTSNIFAILGLRSIYFLLANLADRFYLLKYGIALLLVFIGLKMLVAPWVDISVLITLSVVAAILLTTIALSSLRRPK